MGFAALPQLMAVRLCLTGEGPTFLRGCASEMLEA